ncbi:UvrD-like helicase, ATP-binding domain, P-loop containing nucleoside triphosphate hydrolase [Tanacetum coccineum]
MATHGRKKAIAEPAPPAHDPRDDSPTEETETDSNVWDDGLEDVNPFGGGNPLLTKETESEPIIWDIGDKEEEYLFVNEYPSFKEEPIMFLEDESCLVYDTDNKEAESMAVYDTDIEDVNEEEGKMKLSPTVMTYNLLYGHCKHDYVDNAYSSIIEAICKQGSVEEAHTLLDSLKEKGIKVNEVIYTTLIDGYFQKGKADSGTNLFLEMLITGCLPNSWTYTVMINGFCKDDKMQEVLYLIGKLLTMDVRDLVFAMRSYWQLELFSAGRKVSKFLLDCEYLKLTHNNRNKLQYFFRISTNYFDLVFPLEWRTSVSGDLISLRESDLSLNFLDEIVLQSVGIKGNITYCTIGRVMMTCLGSRKPLALYEHITRKLQCSPSWKSFAEKVLIGDSKYAYVAQALQIALQDTYVANWRLAGYMSP